MQDFFSIESLLPLYEDVQSSALFEDSKFFVDCIPNKASEEILKDYLDEKIKEDFDLKKFVIQHFTMPTNPDTGYESQQKPIAQHLDTLWNVLSRRPDESGGTLIPLPHPYIVPGGRFREIYYWDSYFTMLGLQVSGRDDIMKNMVDNFSYLISKVGHIPNGNRTYYLSRSQPPFFSLMVALMADKKENEILPQYLEALEKEYQFFMDGVSILNEANIAHRRVVRLSDGTILNRYYDDKDTPRPEAYREDVHIASQSNVGASITYRNIRAAAESGWDFSSRWFRDGQNMHTIQTLDLLPVDLNCLLLHHEELLLKIYTLTGDLQSQDQFSGLASQRKNAIQSYCWNETKGFYFDYHFIDQTTSEEMTLAGLFPLFFSIASKEQAAKVVEVVKTHFLKPGGVVTTLKNTGQQWDAPNGWAPLQWITYRALLNYGYIDLAAELNQNWTTNNKKVYDNTGKMMEKYNVEDISLLAGGGEYDNQDGFGWTNGVYLRMHNDEDSSER